MTARQLEHERIGQAGQRVIDRVADVAMIDVDAVGAGHELDDLSRVQRPVDRLEGGRRRGRVPGERQRDLAQRCADRPDAGQVARRGGLGRAAACGSGPVGAFLVDDAAIDEPGQRRVERREAIDRETILGVVGVQEVEGVLEVDVVGVALGRPE